MIRSDKLHAAIERFYEAERIANAVNGCLEGTVEEAALFAAIDDIKDGGYVATTPGGAMAALRLLQKEVHNFASGPITCPLIDGAITYFDGLETVSPGAARDALNMVDAFPDMLEVTGSGWFAVQDGLNNCIDILGGILCRPQCGGHRMNAAGEYLEAIEQFLMFEKTRVMESAACSQAVETETEKHHRLRAILELRAGEAELTIEQLEQVIASIEGMDAGRVTA